MDESWEQMIESANSDFFNGRDDQTGRVTLITDRHNPTDPLQHSGNELDLMQWKIAVKERIQGIYGDCSSQGARGFRGHVQQANQELQRLDYITRSYPWNRNRRPQNQTIDTERWQTYQTVEHELIQTARATVQQFNSTYGNGMWRQILTDEGIDANDATLKYLKFPLSNDVVNLVD
mmetsp:Transcript_18888/g.24349  ORF Transcript_18888/g.24349 Transcript_18888/m.24349 type:complete len:177 (+) Transcript_18888:85-615(+)